MYRIFKCLLALILAAQAQLVAAEPAVHLAEAISYQTVSYQDRSKVDAAEFERLHRFLRATYPRVFAELEVETVNEHSLLIHWPGTNTEIGAILFTAHMDVVPVESGTEQDWDYPPFAGVVAKGKIYGRGALDDKQGVIGLLEAAEQLLEQGFQPERSVVFGFGHDEEIGGEQGAGAIAARMQALGLRADWMVDEGGMLLSDNPLVEGYPVAMVNVAEKSYLTLTLVATGTGGHSSQPPAVTAIGRLSAAMARIEQNPFPPRLVAPVRAMLETIGPYADQPQRLMLENLWATDWLVAKGMARDPLSSAFVRTTTALTMFNAGVKENVVPQRAEAKVNFRLLPGDTPELVVSYIKELVNDALIEISYDGWNKSAPVADYQGSGFAVISDAILAVFPDAVVVPSLLSGATDTRHYIDVAGNHYRFHGNVIETGQISSIHGTNEYISVDSFEKSIDVARQMIMLGSSAD